MRSAISTIYGGSNGIVVGGGPAEVTADLYLARAEYRSAVLGRNIKTRIIMNLGLFL